MKTMLLVLAFLLGGRVASAFASNDNATMTFKNQSGQWLTFYVDGVKSATVPPGDQGSDVVTVGRHTFKAESSDGKQSVSRTIDVPASGSSWTITPPPAKKK
jgi:hypothetical protein